ncbi:MAG: AAA family ATPase [Longimicrobiales bacterium]|nr:AAA family ATPase [Longimicrobiales bacterium]
MARRVHPSTQLAWAIANREASAAGSPEIEPVHLFVALLQIIDDAYHQEAIRLDLAPEDLADVESLAREGRAALGLDADGLTRLRRKTRRDLQGRAAAPATGPLHRSARLRGLFALAEEMAARDGPAPADLRHLVRATLTFPSPDLAGVVPGRGVDKPELTWETRIHRFADELDLGRITILVSDIEGSTALKSRYGDRACAKIFRAHDELFREHLARSQGGQMIKSLGDGFLLAFPSEVAAVRFALQVQDAVRARPELARIPLLVRMGLHCGEILRRVPSGSTLSEPFFGIAIDLASRVSSLARGNQILLDGEVYEGSHAALDADPPEGLGALEWRSYGLYWVKGSDTPVDIHEVGEAGKAAFVRPAASAKAGPVDAPVAAGLGVSLTPSGSAHSHPATPSLDLLGRDLTQAAREHRLGPVLGRRDEILALARHLNRTAKRNVLIVGDAGVGKTAVVEGFAGWIVSGASAPMDRLRVVQLSVGDIVAGARHRGDLEERVQGILKDATSDPDVVLFLDEVHLALMSGEGAADLASLLKPALAREDFRCIGATTTAEYDRFLKSDPAFVRRFQLLRVDEPDRATALEICRGWARRIEERQDVVVSEEAVEAAVRLSQELIRGRALPDKAIDLLENAATRATLSTLSPRLAAPTKERPVLGSREIELALESQYGLAVRPAGEADAGRLRTALESELVGQGAAVQALVRGLDACDAGRRGDRPRGIFLLTGPTGVGKTRAAELMAEGLFGPGSLFRINMSELKERHELARLIGAPPGFVGHEAGSPLFLHLERRPRGLILLDEAEKAHPEIQDWFLQVFDKGSATDPHGRLADFRQQLFVLTCNVTEGPESEKIGFAASTSEADPSVTASTSRDEEANSLRAHFRPEFLARLDRIVRFTSLGREDFRKLLTRELSSRDASNALQQELVEDLLDRCVGMRDGARGFRRLFEGEVLPLLRQPKVT